MEQNSSCEANNQEPEGSLQYAQNPDIPHLLPSAF
jgi:hypothetical protein